MLFYYALACTILIDQTMYTYFKLDYEKFKQMTLYPKIECGITNINVRPWDIIHNGFSLTTLEQFLTFFIQDIKTFFMHYEFKQATWNNVKEFMLKDKDIIKGSRGALFKEILVST